jgi:CheY-like chemotaxis protein
LSRGLLRLLEVVTGAGQDRLRLWHLEARVLQARGIEPQLIVILSDINMPGMDGLHLLGEIKRRFRDIPVMMVTADGDDERRRRASDLGACEFLAKPVDFDALKAQLRQLSAAP